MLISVIIPNYNHADFLAQRIQSILDQTRQDFEIILLDDCSTDNSREIIAKYSGHPKVSHVIYNPQNSGSLYRQWQKGIELAAGEYIWIAESDDYAAPEFLEELVPVLDNDPSLSFVYCDTRVVPANGIPDPVTYAARRNQLMGNEKWSRSYRNNGRREIAENLLEICSVNNAISVLFRKEALLGAEPFDRGFRYIGDWYCYLKLCMLYDMAYVNKPLNFYRVHDQNASRHLTRNLAHTLEYFKLYDWAIRNINFIKKEKILKDFKAYTRHSLTRGWNRNRFRLYLYFAGMNPELFRHLLQHTITAPFYERFRKR